MGHHNKQKATVHRLLSHLACSGISFHLGSLYGVASVPSSSTTLFAEHRATTATPAAATNRQFPPGVKFLRRDDFLENFDLGVPWQKGPGDVLLLRQPRLSGSFDAVQEAVQECDEINIVLTDSWRSPHSCIAVVDHRPSYHIHRWMKEKNRQWKAVSRYAGTEAALQHPPKPINVNESLKLLQEYLMIKESVIKELKPIAARVADAGSVKNTVVVMVCNAGHLEILLNFLCAARKTGVDLSTFLLFATDQKTKIFADQFGLISYFNPGLFASVPSDADSYGTMPYALVMMSKENYVEQFVEATQKAGDFDLFFQYDHSEAQIYQPWSANSGFYYAKTNPRTKYFFSSLLKAGDMILRTKSHQAVMGLLLSQHSSQFGLRVRVLHEESKMFPGKPD